MDPAGFLWFTADGKIDGIVLLHVDDFRSYGSANWYTTIQPQIVKLYPFTDWEFDRFKYTGVTHVANPDGGFAFNMIDFVAKMTPVDVKNLDKILEPNQNSSLKDKRKLNEA